MNRLARVCVTFACGLLAVQFLCACREKPPEKHDDIIRAGLAEIISHQGTACDEVTSWEIDRRLDYHVRCENGQTYRVHVGAEGHINVDEHLSGGK